MASGSGALILPAARLGAQVTPVNLSPAMIERLRARAEPDGLVERVDARVTAGHALGLEDDAFDVAASQFGVMLSAALVVMAASRLVPLSVVQFHVQGVAGLVAFWPLARHAGREHR